jgi:hypothetical protein
MRFHNPPRQVQPQPTASPLVIALTKALKQHCLILFGNASSGVFNLNAQPIY